jgi:hypothetical protein
MYAFGQNLLAGDGTFPQLIWCDADCSPAPTPIGPFSTLPNPANQSTVLIGDTNVNGSDIAANLNLDTIAAGGAVCWLTNQAGFDDCVSWGTFNATGAAFLTSTYGSDAATGTPFGFALPGGTQAMRRDISANCATLLEAADDTNDSAADFDDVTRNPRPNSVAPSETPCGGGGPGPGGGGGTTTAPGNPTSPINPAGNIRQRKCKKSNRSATVAKKKCKKKKGK